MLMEVSKLFKKYAHVISFHNFCSEIQIQFKIPDDEQLVISEMVEESAISVSINSVPFTCRITLTSVLLREVDLSDNVDEQVELLPRSPCLNALAELRHTKYYQVISSENKNSQVRKNNKFS
jgi:hypothetical protein